jgi:hypothetical protein
MGYQGLGVFLIRTCWFRDFLAISKLCAPWVSATGDVGKNSFFLPGRVFFKNVTQIIFLKVKHCFFSTKKSQALHLPLLLSPNLPTTTFI